MPDDPLIIAVAPNGARKTKVDHPALPISPDELGREAAACRAAGAAMIHLHVRADDDTHSLDVDRYRAAIAAVRREAGSDFIIQVTSEAVGRYTPAEQRAMVQTLRPEAVSLAVRELCPDASYETDFAAFTDWMRRESVHPQYILYDADDVRRFAVLRRRGIVAGESAFVLYVLGRYSKSQTSEPTDLLPFLDATRAEGAAWHWAVCAFGPKEGACALTAAALGGHCRVGFENNLALANGETASDNAALVGQVSNAARLAGRQLADPVVARALLAME